MLLVDVEHFDRDGTPMIAMPKSDWLRIEDFLEERALVNAYDAAMAEVRTDGVPFETAMAILDGVHPVKAYRNVRNMTQTELATMVGVKQSAIARIESGAREGRPGLLAKLAEALNIPSEVMFDFARNRHEA